MERENFYILLALSVNPAEDDKKIIELAIKQKQSEWSRLRNHPTKALKAKQYIGMLPEIIRIMSNPELRKAEALNAAKILAKKAIEKFSVIDRHLAICMSKGFITDKEIFNLAKRHSVKANDIKKRIKEKEDEKYSKINKQLKLQTAKGYITKDEIAEIAATHAVSEKELRKSITCPVKKKNQTVEKHKALDKSLAKIIKQNLKITGNSSLYQFLDLPPESSLEKIQKKAKEKEKEFLNIGKKDAVNTAGIALAGHCLSIFKNQNSRNSYDMANSLILFKDLNADIDVAGMDGKIRSESYKALINSAALLGMNKNQANNYIKDYADKKNLQLEIKQKKSAWIPYAAISAIMLLIGAGTGIFLHIKNETKLKKEYQLVLVDLENYTDLQKKKQILRNYINSHKKNDQTIDAEKQLKKLRFAIDEIKIKKIIGDADELLIKKEHQKALTLYKEFISKYPKNLCVDKIREKISYVKALLHEIDYKKLYSIKSMPVQARAAAYLEYIEKYPQGKDLKNIKKILGSMCEEYYIALIKEIALCEKKEDWEKGILLSDNFIKFYPDTKRAVEIKEQRDNLSIRLWDKEKYALMLQQVKEKGSDYQAGREIFTDYLKAYPDSYIKDKIKAELIELNKKELGAKKANKKERLTRLIKKAGKRFTIYNNGTVKDKNTGMIWCIADSFLETGDCLDYAAAIKYVKNLRTGGVSDWRLPTVNELAQIYKHKPFFPQDDSDWYWTSKSYSRYADCWSKVVDVVTSKNQLTWKKEEKDSMDCGSVRAVRIKCTNEN
ncbi:MAG: DUF1566 domain-containing protein [Desulfosarcina sp.]|nr:DUF1566 domain-containing protein [Desulfobacterales bacterium]